MNFNVFLAHIQIKSSQKYIPFYEKFKEIFFTITRPIQAWYLFKNKQFKENFMVFKSTEFLI